MKQYLEAGQIVSTHGIKGELKVVPWCDSPAFFCRLKRLYLSEGGEPLRVVRARAQSTTVILALEGVETVEQGDLFRNKILYLNRDDVSLPEGRFFQQDLIGLSVLDADSGVLYGTLTEIVATGANDVYQVTDKSGKNYLIPAVPAMIAELNPEAGKVLVRPIKGIFDDEN